MVKNKDSNPINVKDFSCNKKYEKARKILDSYFQKDGRIYFSKPKKISELPDLLSLQKRWYESFINHYVHKLFDDINPIYDIWGEKMYLTIWDVKISDAINTVEESKTKELTYGGIISGKVKLTELKESENGKISEKSVFSKRVNIGTMPIMTPSASYIINGIERVIISQIVRSYGIFYNRWDFNYGFKLIPEIGPWMEVVIEKSWVIAARIDKSRKFPITALFRLFGAENDETIRALFSGCFEDDDFDYIEQTLTKDSTHDALSAAEFIYSKLRPGELIDPESALDFIKHLFLDLNRIFVGKIARRKINAKLSVNKEIWSDEGNVFDFEDIVASVKYLLNLANFKKGYYVDDADHLSNKRIRAMWETLHSHLSPVMRKFAKSVRGKLSVLNTEEPIKVTSIVNFKIIDNAIKGFFATSQLSQFLDQTNPLSETEHKRRITALGPGGLKRETAKFEVRDVHPSHYGRICPIQTPEWQNIWLVLYMSLFSLVNDEGFLETPALKILKEVEVDEAKLENRIADRDVFEFDAKWKETKKLIVKEDCIITKEIAKKIVKSHKKHQKVLNVKPFFSGEVEFISPEQDEKYFIADASTTADDNWNITETRVSARHFDQIMTLHVKDITHMDLDPSQLFSPNTSLIPFIANDDAVRASMGTNQHRQALPLLENDAPLVGTGLESTLLHGTHYVMKAEADWEVVYVDARRVKVKYKSWIKEYLLDVFKRSNHKTCITQEPVVSLGQKVKEWDLLAEGPCSRDGEIALWKNLKIAFMPWKGYNYEDAIVISERLVKNDALTSIQIEVHEIEVADTKLGAEETTNDIPWVSLNKLWNLDNDGIVVKWVIVKWWDILVGKITPKGAGELTPEEKLIQAIFWDKSKSIKDTSLYMPSGSTGKVLDVVVLDAKKWDNLMAGIRQKIKVYIATTRKIEVWDKLAGKHGNKWIVSIVVPEEDMPFDKGWEPIDVVLNPLWVISRMNLWQLFEAQLWLIAKRLGVKFSVPAFTKFWLEEFQDLVTKLGMEDEVKTELFDGQTWEKYSQSVTVWYMSLLKLIHMVDDKIHARSVGPYSLITQQPLGGKARQWWQRFWEMEVWALEAYSAVYSLQEMLTVKSDDVIWRNKMYESIIRGEQPKIWGLPESFNLVTYLFKWLWQNIKVLDYDELESLHQERIEKIKGLWLSDIINNVEAVDDEEPKLVAEEDEEEKADMIDNILQDIEESWGAD